MRIEELAPAKLNLTLDVGEKHPDGYHDVISVMTGAALYDTLTLESGTGNGITLTCSDSTLACDETNLAYRAAKLFFEHSGIVCDGVSIHLEKRIPMQAGLGGGSSDAAAVLRGLRRLYAPDMPLCELERISIRLGSDVPYCICSATTLVTGRGEQLRQVAPMPACWYVLCQPDEFYSTAAMYRLIDETQPQCDIDTEAMLSALEQGDLQKIATGIANIFEAVLPDGNQVVPIREKLLELGADAACMSGSGSAVFGLFIEKATATVAYEALKMIYPRTFLAQSV